jgi:acetyl-CoA carboxylase biotin carboxyl carrier protein
VAAKDLGEITIADGEKTITVKGKKCLPPMPLPPAGAPVAAAAVMADPAEAPAVPQKPAGKAIKAPLVGTFYAAPSPDQKPFVQVGDTVKKGDVVLIIESMKLMNEVTSDIDGVVQEILVKNGEAVEYDQPLMILS